VLASSHTEDEVAVAPGSEEVMHRYGSQNPVNWRRWSPADGAMRLSGRIGRRELVRLEFYDGFMRPNRLRDMLKIWLWSSAESAACIQLLRRDADFTPRTQDILAILHHHLIHLRAEALTTPSGPARPSRCSPPAEAEVLILACRGASDATIAERLGTSEATVGKHLQHAYDALGVHSRSEALWRLSGAATPARTHPIAPS
jgi:DNA-binding CsgD family transcriptional regulator